MIMIFALSACEAAAQTPSDSGYIQFVGNSTVVFTDASRNNRSISSLVYYPATAEGLNAPVLSGGKYPVLSFGHGFTLNPNLYVAIYRHLASWGYIVVAPSTETGFFPSHSNFSLDLAFVIKDMKRKNRVTSDFFFNVIDTVKCGVFGHSMGGGCSVLAGNSDTSITAVASLAAANTNPSSIAAAEFIRAPQLYLSGQRDSIASFWTQQLPHYNNSFPFRQIVNIIGGNHSYFHLVPGLDDLVDNPATISRAEQQRLTRKYVTAFFNVFIKNDQESAEFLYGSSALSDTSVILACRNFSARTLLQGFYDPLSMQMRRDTVKFTARETGSPYGIVSSAKAYVDQQGYAEYFLPEVFPGRTYFLQFTHRNSIETWSSAGGTIIETARPFFDMTISSSAAFGNNLIEVSGKFCIYGGDVNTDGIVDAFDQSIADNDAFTVSTGYLPSDVNGDGITDASDLSLIDNGAFNFVQKIVPP